MIYFNAEDKDCVNLFRLNPKDGHIAHKTCSHCDLLFDVDGNVITNITIPQLDHTYNKQVVASKYLKSALECSI